MEFATETIAQVRGEIEVLLQRHFDELAQHKGVQVLNPLWHQYQALENERALAVFTARQGIELVGYSVFFLNWNLHYKDLLQAMNDVVFIDKPHREGSAGLKLLKYSEAKLKELGCRKIAWHVKTAQDWGPILKRMGYAPEETIWSRTV